MSGFYSAFIPTPVAVASLYAVVDQTFFDGLPWPERYYSKYVEYFEEDPYPTIICQPSTYANSTGFKPPGER